MAASGTPTGGREAVGQVSVRPFGKYFLVRKLAEGGMAEIFLAKQVGVEGFERNVVIKRMLQHLSSVPDFVNMFLDEARLATRLNHPNVVQINDLGNADGCYYICMEYLAGEDFSTVVRTAARRREYVPLNVVMRVIAEAARGLHFAHDFTDAKGNPLNIVHRDVSPSNIFLTYTGQVKVLDFGIARAESRVTQTTAGVVKGKYQYMAPEQARTGIVDRRADVYSLGVSLYEAITNTRPFARDNDLAILNAVLANDYKKPELVRPDLPEEVSRIIVKALAGDVEERYQSALELAQDLEAFLQGHTSGGGNSSLATFMAAFFGPDRMMSKTRIDSLAELATKGVDVPGFKNPSAPGTDPSITNQANTEGETKAVGLPTSVKVKRRTGYALLASVVALVLGLGGALTWALFFRQPSGGAQKPLEVPDAGVVLPPPAVVDAGPPEPVDAGAPVPVPEVDAGEPKHPQLPVGPVTLTAPLIMKVVGAHKSAIYNCFQQHKGDLPADEGRLKVTFTIPSSGKVSSAQSELSDKAVGQCVEKVVKQLRFPVHKDKEVTLTVPLEWQVKR